MLSSNHKDTEESSMKHTDAARGRSRGFTLVEMLIVIIIIGILAGMMMLSTGAATDKAEATRIVSDMRSMKTACVMYYADSGERRQRRMARGDKRQLRQIPRRAGQRQRRLLAHDLRKRPVAQLQGRKARRGQRSIRAARSDGEGDRALRFGLRRATAAARRYS